MRQISIFVMVEVLAALVAAASTGPAFAGGKKAKQLRWHGSVARISSDGSVYTINGPHKGGMTPRDFHVNADTKFTTPKGKSEVSIDKGDVKEGDDVICFYTEGENKEFVATQISKR